MPNIYIISGCNGAGKTTASFTVLPEILNCRNFINADEIAKGLSPFSPEDVAIEAGKIMLSKIEKYISTGQDFAFETTLATKSYVNKILRAKEKGYEATLLFFWLGNVDLAIERVKLRVKSGGHDIPVNVIKRRYYAGIKNLFNLYLPICNYWMIFDNSSPKLELVAEGNEDNVINIENFAKFDIIKMQRNDN